MLLAQCRRLPMTRVTQVAFLALLIMLAQQSAALTWRLLTLASPQTSQPWQPSAVAVNGQSNPRLELGEVSRLALFGKAIPKAQAKAAVAANAPRTSSMPSSTECWQARIPPNPSPSSPCPASRTPTGSVT